MVLFFFDKCINHFHMCQNAPCLSPQILYNHCFQFVLGITVTPREKEDKGYAFFGACGKQVALWSMVNYKFFLDIQFGTNLVCKRSNLQN